MTQTLLTLVADLQLALAAAVSVGGTTATLQTSSDLDDVALPSGKYGFTVDGDNSSKEFIVCDLIGTALTNIFSISRQGVATAGFANYHRVGATVTVTDWAILDRINNNLRGITGFDSGAPLKYDGQPALSDPTAIPTVQYVIDLVNGGAVSINAIVIAGDAGETIADGEWVYFNTTDGEWYKTDADATGTSVNVQIGKARGAGTNGNPITGGIFIAGIETVGTYVAGTTYYLSNTAGALSSSAGTNSVIVGVGDANGELILKDVAPSTISALTGGSTFGTPSSTNKFITQEYNSSATGLPIVRTYLNAASPATWTKPAGLKYIVVEVQAVGGASATTTTTDGATGGGGGGGYGKKLIAVASLGATETVTIGAGGATSSFGAHVVATNGASTTANSAAGASGGGCTGGDINITGGTGDASNGGTSATGGGRGGDAVLGSGGGSPPTGTAANSGDSYGGGSSGTAANSSSDVNGGSGGAAIVIVTEYYS